MTSTSAAQSHRPAFPPEYYAARMAWESGKEVGSGHPRSHVENRRAIRNGQDERIGYYNAPNNEWALEHLPIVHVLQQSVVIAKPSLLIHR